MDHMDHHCDFRERPQDELRSLKHNQPLLGGKKAAGEKSTGGIFIAVGSLLLAIPAIVGS